MALRPEFVVTDAQGKGLAWVRTDGNDIDALLAIGYCKDKHCDDVIAYRDVPAPIDDEAIRTQ